MGRKMKRKTKIIGVISGVFLLMLPLYAKAAEITQLPEMESEETTEPEETTESEETTEPEETAEPDETTEPEEVPVQELDLGDYSNKMEIGEKQLLSVTVLPMDANSNNIAYSSSNPNVATVNGMGRITALAAGSTTITVSAGEVRQSFELQIVEKADTTIPVTDIEIGEHESELEVGKTLTLSGTVLPSDASNSALTYTSSNPEIATVNSSGEVKGISRGDVTITLSAGGFSKHVPLKVKIATAGIKLNKDFLVLKPNDTYQLSASATPAEASQTINYHSTDTAIAAVSSNGFVTAKATGSTTIIVSNGDTSAAVSVIVNEPVRHQEQVASADINGEDKKEYKGVIYASEQKIIDSEMLSYLYEAKQIMKIIGDGYIIEIDGKDIVNDKNEFYTDIALEKQSDKMCFLLNGGKELCGAVTLYLEEPNGNYLYLYNPSKEKYERIDISNREKLTLTTAGEYQLCESKLQTDKRLVIYCVVGGIIVLLLGGAIYIVVKRRYWFW